MASTKHKLMDRTTKIGIVVAIILVVLLIDPKDAGDLFQGLLKFAGGVLTFTLIGLAIFKAIE